MEGFKGSRFLIVSIPGSFLLGRKGLNNQMSQYGCMEGFKGSRFLIVSIPGSFLLGRKGLNNQMSYLDSPRDLREAANFSVYPWEFSAW